RHRRGPGRASARGEVTIGLTRRPRRRPAADEILPATGIRSYSAAMHVHFIGVAGTGMGALAGLFKAAGHDVSGSDAAFHPPMGPALERWGIRLMTGFDAAHLEPAPDLVVVGNVCRPWNVE